MDMLTFGFMPKRLVTNLVIALNPNAPASFMSQRRCQIQNPFDKPLPEFISKDTLFPMKTTMVIHTAAAEFMHDDHSPRGSNPKTCI
jgi:hypothetical protein